MSDAVPDRRTPRWGLAMGLLVAVSAVIFGLAKLVPFEPSVDGAAAAGGDPTRGAALFATNCSSCHGQNGAGGGIGPTLAGVPRDADTVAGVIATGRGAMPGGLVSGDDAADVVAYVGSIGGGAPAGTPSTPKGTVTLAGDRLGRVVIQLDAPAPDGWSVWVDGSAGPRRLAAVGSGERLVRVDNAAVGGAAAATAILVGPSADRPALRADIAGLGELLVSSSTAPGGASLVDAAAGQIDVLREHIRFLRRARDEENLANIRFHGEHMVNIIRGNPPADVDGNGDPSNPGDGVGLLGRSGDDGYLPRIVALVGPNLEGASGLDAAIAAIARDGQRCGSAESVAAGRPCVQAIAARDPGVARSWQALATAVRGTATVPLVSVP